MADAPKRKKLEKIKTDPIPQGNQRFVCCRCGRAYSRQKGFFPVSHSPMYRGSGYLPICSECVDELYEIYREALSSDREAMRRMCMKLDLYWSDSIYDMVERTAGVNSRIRNYIGKTNIIRYIDKTFDDTLLEEAINNEEKKTDAFDFDARMKSSEEEDALAQIEQRVIDFWGVGYSASFYEDLERHYKEWTENKPTLEPNERALYKQICLLEVIIARDGAQGKAIEKNVNALNAVLGSMSLKPVQKKEEADAALESMPLGVGIEKWEHYRPLPPTETSKKDVNGLIRNVTTWFLGHAGKMVGLRNSYVQMYEDEMTKLRVKRPEYEDEDDDTILTDIFKRSTTNDSNSLGL